MTFDSKTKNHLVPLRPVVQDHARKFMAAWFANGRLSALTLVFGQTLKFLPPKRPDRRPHCADPTLAAFLFLLCFLFSAFFASGKPLSDCTVWTFNQGCWDRPAADLASSVRSDYLMRAWFKWWQARDFQKEKLFIPIAKSHGALFGGGTTISALYSGENGLSQEKWRRMATRDPFDQIPPAWGKSNIAHGAIGSEEYLDYCLGWCYAQIDAGVDSLFLDEVEGAYRPNEGFDDASMTKFADWLTRRYCGNQGWTSQDPRWNRLLKVDMADPKLCPDGTVSSFNYRNYLVQHGWADGPDVAANPLREDWSGFVTWRADWACEYLCDHIHAYAKSKGREVSVAVNGSFTGGFYRYVDFQIAGFQQNEWLGSRGHVTTGSSYLRKYRSAVVAGADVVGKPTPVVFFHDFGFDGFAFKELSAADRIKWMKVYAPEIYAAGGFFCWPVNIAQTNDLALIKHYASWYQDHHDWFHGGEWLGGSRIAVSAKKISVAWWEFPALKQRVVHLINHNWNQTIVPQKQVEVQIPSGIRPRCVVWASPEIGGDRPLEFTWADKTLRVRLPSIEGYAALALTYDQLERNDVADSSAEITPRRVWAKAKVNRFTVDARGNINDPNELHNYVQGGLHPDVRNNPTFLVDYNLDGQFLIHVDVVAKSGATMNISVDGKSILTQSLSHLDNINDGGEHDQVYALPIAKGKHEIRVDNTGGDWFSVDYYEFVLGPLHHDILRAVDPGLGSSRLRDP